MFRLLSGNTSKNIPIVKAGEALKRGAPVAEDATGDLVKATTAGECFFVEAVKNYDGINAVITPKDSSFEDIADGDMCLKIPTYLGEEYATTELTVGSLAEGDYLKAAAGKFVAAAQGDVSVWRYGGTYSDPTGLTMYVVKRVPSHTLTA